MRPNTRRGKRSALERTTQASHPQVFSIETGQRAQIGFAAVAGLFFFIVVLKLGNPVILDSATTPPSNWLEVVYQSWPLRWGYWLSVPVFATGLLAIFSKHFFNPDQAKRQSQASGKSDNPESQPPPICNGAVSRTLLVLPLIWLGWQFVAATHTVSPALTKVTLGHFTVSVALFYLAYSALGSVSNPWPLWVGLALALAWVIHAGFDQHFGGLEATRRMVSASPEWKNAAPEYVKRLMSDRIFSTFMYPNALAGGILLLLPLSLVFLWFLTPKVSINGRRAFVVILGGCGLACLYWSGSKAGWLIALAAGLIVLLHSPMDVRWKRRLIFGTIIIGLLGFAARYAKFFQRGSTSVVARFDYWASAVRTVEEHPLFGSGPGTFSVPYGQWQSKNPKSEMAKLTHNDYLEQASDSGVVGFVAFLIMIPGFLVLLYRCSVKKRGEWHKIHFAVWLGLFALFAHSTVEFHLYYPAFGWTAFFMMGWMAGLATSEPAT